MVRLRHVLLVQAAALLLVWLASASLRATDPAPQLTEQQKAQLTIAILKRDNAQLRLDALVRDWRVPGYDLTATGEYVKQAEKKEKP